MSKKPLLTISILVSNRPDTIEKCLKSLDSLRKRVPSELILTDTGCGTQVREIIEKYADKIIDFEWCDDFAKARNVGLEQAQGDWFMFMDDDEWFEDTDDIEQFFRTDLHHRYNVGEYYVRNYSKLDGSQYSNSVATRVVKLYPDMKFEYSVHESIQNLRMPAIRFRSYVHHYGYAYGTYEEKLKHSRRNITLLEKELKIEPDNMHHISQLVQEYRVIEDWKNMLAMAKEGIRIHGLHAEWRECVIGLYTAVLHAYNSLLRYEDAIEYGEACLREEDMNELGRAGLENLLVRAYYEVGDYEKSIEAVQIYLNIYQKWKEDQYRYLAYETLFLNSCFGEAGIIAAYGTGVRAEMQRGDAESAKKYFFEMDWNVSGRWVSWPMIHIMEEVAKGWLQADEQQVGAYDAMMEEIMRHDILKSTVLSQLKRWRLEEPELLRAVSIDWEKWEGVDWFFLYLRLWNHKEKNKEVLPQKYQRMWQEKIGCLVESFDLELWAMAEQDGIDMKDIIGKLPFYYWQSAVLSACNGTKEILNKLQDKIMKLDGLDSYHLALWQSAFGLKKLQWVCEEETSVSDVIEELLAYAELTYDLYHGLYRDELFESRQELLPRECQLSLKILAMRDAVEGQRYSEAVACVKEALTIMPKASQVLKYCTRWIEINSTKKQNEEQKQVDFEMQTLAVAVKKQVRNFLSQNLVSEAEGILQQLRSLVPNDAELSELQMEIQRKR